ncbi:MAG: enoyl-[acyl-carrier-protein] reductase FabV [Dehalococcoidia bacterium]|nr:enoyl-[acyl-carrier-protein] reductase FabV [Dehalococcoidia bacterium]
MSKEIIQPRTRGFISLSSHPDGLKFLVKKQIDKVNKTEITNIKNVLVVGSSMGYGLASTIYSLYGLGANTLGVCYERPPLKAKTGSAGWYNSGELIKYAESAGLNLNVVNGDAFNDNTKKSVIELLENTYGQIDLLIYSLASPRRIDSNGITWNSTLKPIGSDVSLKNINLQSNTFETSSISKATEEEINATTKVMGGEDWDDWVTELSAHNLISENFKTVAFSYVGPKVTEQIYRTGTIGIAKKHLESTVKLINNKLNNSSTNSRALISVNKAIVTQASSAIPGVPLYMSMLFKLMKQNNTNELAIDQIIRLFENKLLDTNAPIVDNNGFIRLDDYELENTLQDTILKQWDIMSADNFLDLIDFDQYKIDFHQIFGFNVNEIDYKQLVETDPEYSINTL